MFALGTQGTSYALIPQPRGPSLTIPLADPLPPSPRAVPPQGDAHPAAPPLSLSARFETGPSAASYVLRGQTALDDARALLCLTSAIYYEAASESEEGQRAVAQVILNRVRHPAWPNSVCGVVYQGSDRPGCQFSYACDGSMARLPMASAWQRAARIARDALAGAVFAPVGLATYYHTLRVNPDWNRPLTITAVIGQHIFYRLPDAMSAPSAFSDRYAAREPYPGPLPRSGPISAPRTMLLADRSNADAPLIRQDPRYVAGTLPESDILPQFRQSGSWIEN